VMKCLEVGQQIATKWPSKVDGPQVINKIQYTVHALEQMAPRGFGGRGVPPSVVQNAIDYGSKTVGNTIGTVVSTYENVAVVTNDALNRVITVITKGH